MPKALGLNASEIEQETAVSLPEREAMSLIDGGVKLVPMSPLVVASPNPPIDHLPEDPTGQGA